MKAHYVSSLQHRAVQRANGTFRVQALDHNLLVGGKATRDCDPWVNISPKLSQSEALIMLRRFEPDLKIARFFGRNGEAL